VNDVNIFVVLINDRNSRGIQLFQGYCTYNSHRKYSLHKVFVVLINCHVRDPNMIAVENLVNYYMRVQYYEGAEPLHECL
jgi:hypothetical protein